MQELGEAIKKYRMKYNIFLAAKWARNGKVFADKKFLVSKHGTYPLISQV